MEPINGLSNIMEILRRQISDNAKRLDKTGKSGGHRAARNVTRSGTTSPKELRALIQDRIKGLNADEARYQYKAKRLFLESVVISEFGNEISRDQGFNDMLDDIQDVIESNADTKQLFDSLIGELSAHRDPS